MTPRTLSPLKSSFFVEQLGLQHPLHKLMTVVASAPVSSQKSSIYWKSQHFGLQASKYFSDLQPSVQEKILQDLSHRNLSLGYYIEKFGLHYGARMILEGQTLEEKSLYSLFAGQEVQHRLMLESFLEHQAIDNIEFHPLLKTLETILLEGQRESLVFAIQVLLEGFGLVHYTYLGQGCDHPDLKKVFDSILKDEAAHHGMGLQLAQNLSWENPKIQQELTDFSAMIVRSLVEADWVQEVVSDHSGGMTAVQAQEFREQTLWKEKVQTRLSRLRALILKVAPAEMMQTLEAQGVFRADLG